MTTVAEALADLQKLVNEGHGDLPLYGVHGASGCSYEASISSLVSEKGDHDDAGPLCEEDNGMPYVSVYLD